jgi:hypothetical protein
LIAQLNAVTTIPLTCVASAHTSGYFNGAGNTGACTNGNEMNEQQCKDFAAANGYSWHGTGHWHQDYPNCQGDTTGSIGIW